MPILPTCVTVPLSLGTNDWLLRLSTSEADEDDGDSPANPRYCHHLLLLMIHNPQVTQREKETHNSLCEDVCHLPIPVSRTIGSEEPGLSAEREGRGGRRRGPLDVTVGADAC
jgi:hypothetical protein